MARYRGKVPSPQANDFGALATTSDYFVDVDDGAGWDLAALNGLKKPLEHIITNTKVTELQETSCLVDAAFSSPLRQVVGFVF